MRTLLEHGADAGVDAYNFEYPIMFAARGGNVELMELLVPHSGRAFKYATCGRWDADSVMSTVFKNVKASVATRLRPLVENACAEARVKDMRAEARNARKRQRTQEAA